MTNQKLSLGTRFYRQVNKNGPLPGREQIQIWPELKNNKCWIWGGKRNWAGYGLIETQRIRKRIHGKRVTLLRTRLRAHRVGWELFRGEQLSSGQYLCHKCDNPSCVNPDHLFKGTNQTNQLDRYAKENLTRKK